MTRSSWRYRSFRYPFSSNLYLTIPKDIDDLELFFFALFSGPSHSLCPIPLLLQQKVGFFRLKSRVPLDPFEAVSPKPVVEVLSLGIVLLRAFTDLSVFPRIIIAPGRHTSCNPIKHVVMRLLGISYQFKHLMNSEPAISRLPCLMIVALIGCNCAAFR